MKERKKLKEIYSQHKYAIQIAIFVIAFFIAGYLVSWNFTEKPLNDRQFELYEQVARDMYDQKGNVIVEAPEDFSVSIFVSMTTTTITIKSADNQSRGKVIAKLQNGELVMTRDMETGKAIGESILMGIVFVLGTILAYAMFLSYGDYKKIKKQSGK